MINSFYWLAPGFLPLAAGFAFSFTLIRCSFAFIAYCIPWSETSFLKQSFVRWISTCGSLEALVKKHYLVGKNSFVGHSSLPGIDCFSPYQVPWLVHRCFIQSVFCIFRKGQRQVDLFYSLASAGWYEIHIVSLFSGHSNLSKVDVMVAIPSSQYWVHHQGALKRRVMKSLIISKSTSTSAPLLESPCCQPLESFLSTS